MQMQVFDSLFGEVSLTRECAGDDDRCSELSHSDCNASTTSPVKDKGAVVFFLNSFH